MASQKGKPGGGMMKLIRLLLKKDSVWKAWKQGGGKEQYLQTKQNAKRTVYTAKETAEEKKFSDLGWMTSSKLQNIEKRQPRCGW